MDGTVLGWELGAAEGERFEVRKESNCHWMNNEGGIDGEKDFKRIFCVTYNTHPHTFCFGSFKKDKVKSGNSFISLLDFSLGIQQWGNLIIFGLNYQKDRDTREKKKRP